MSEKRNNPSGDVKREEHQALSGSDSSHEKEKFKNWHLTQTGDAWSVGSTDAEPGYSPPNDLNAENWVAPGDFVENFSAVKEFGLTDGPIREAIEAWRNLQSSSKREVVLEAESQQSEEDEAGLPDHVRLSIKEGEKEELEKRAIEELRQAGDRIGEIARIVDNLLKRKVKIFYVKRSTGVFCHVRFFIPDEGLRYVNEALNGMIMNRQKNKEEPAILPFSSGAIAGTVYYFDGDKEYYKLVTILEMVEWQREFAKLSEEERRDIIR